MTALETTLTQWSLLSGALIGLGLTFLLAYAVPPRPDLAAFLDKMTSEERWSSAAGRPAAGPTAAWEDRLGHWLMRLLPNGSMPTADLDLLRLPPHRYLARRAIFGVSGFAFTTVFSVLCVALGLRPPILVPLAVALALGAGASYLPLLDLRNRAHARRDEFAYGFVVYIDLVGTEHRAGTGTRQAMEIAAEGGDSWMFQRIAEELRLSSLQRESPWDALNRLGEKIGLPELENFAAVMRVSGEDGGAIYQTLRAQAVSLRQTRLAQNLAEANRVGERMSGVTALLAIAFLAILAAPALLRFANLL
ncbi:MAG: type II secretion system F family protein [Propionibacteriaceae bacterium]|jgi:Flp pilus assembly protein TadB|nr:type II secretion system F family protein [Propionibacteriaceae bacterium]